MDEQRIDYVIVLEQSIKFTEKLQAIANLVSYLEEQGLRIKIEHGTVTDKVYINVHLPLEAVHHFAKMYDINIYNAGQTFLPMSSQNIFNSKMFQTTLGKNHDLFRRQENVTNCERILIAEEILNHATFGETEDDYGIEKLIDLEIVKTAYPLHDGDCGSEDQEDFSGYQIPENDRQLLLKYWSNFSLWYKHQPLNLVQKYFGNEVAFYFAWLGFYTRMLIPASIVGVICSTISIVQLLVLDHERVDDICSSKLVMCPLCHSGKSCEYRPLNDSCEYAQVTIVFDNRATVFFAVFMSFWATMFVNLWKRFENTLKIRWNAEFEEMDTKLRVQYKDSCTHARWSPLTGTLEPYTPKSEQTIYYILSYAIFLFLVGVVALFVFSVIMYRVGMTILIRLYGSRSLEKHGKFLLQATSAWLQVLSIKLFGMFYAPLAEWLTDLENPRTQTEFDDSVIHKRYSLAFVNNYASLFYIAFMKGRFYSPDDERSDTGYETDLCHPSGCLMSLCVQLCILMLFKSLFGNIFTLIIPKIRKLAKAASDVELPQWEKEYKLKESGRYLLTNEYLEMIVQYGFVTFFVAAFPLAPFCALINNCLELRLDAYKLVTRYRRPVPRQHSGIGSWNGIMQIITRLSIATNAFVVAFTSDFVVREMYKYENNNSLDGYIRSTFSLYDMRDYKGPLNGPLAVNPVNNSTLCYYKGTRHPPAHPKKYELTPRFWHDIGLRLIFIIIFEHLIMLTNGILAYVIPDVPESVKESLHYERNKEMELKLKSQGVPRGVRKRRPKLKINRSDTRRETVL